MRLRFLDNGVNDNLALAIAEKILDNFMGRLSVNRHT